MPPEPPENCFLVMASPIVADLVASGLDSHPSFSVRRTTYSWVEFMKVWSYQVSTIVIDAFLDDQFPIALKIRALRRLGSQTIVVGPVEANTPIVSRTLHEGALCWIDPRETAVGDIPTIALRSAAEAQENQTRAGQLSDARLSDRELQMLGLFGSRRGLTTSSLANMFGLSEQTVRSQLHSGRQKLRGAGFDVANQAKLAAVMQAEGYVMPSERWNASGHW